MNLKKIIGMLMVIMIIILCTLTIVTSTTYAANDSYILGITNIREGDGGAYGLGGKSNGGVYKKIWKIVSYPTMTSNTIDYSNAFYCIRAEHGFVKTPEDPTEDVTQRRRNYTKKLDMKTEKNAQYNEDGTIKEIGVLERLKAVGSFNNHDGSVNPNADKEYNKIMWVIDNMYLPKQSTEREKIALLVNAGIIENENDDYYGHERITNHDIEVIQQLVLWYFTNKDTYYTVENGSTSVNVYPYDRETLDNLLWSSTDSNYDAFNGDEGRYRQQECAKLYKYFIDNAKSKGDYVSKDAISPLTLDKTRVKVIPQDDSYVIGPFKINVNSIIAYTKNRIEFTNENGEAFEYSLLNANGQTVSNNIEALNGQDFYIKVSEDLEISKIRFDIDINYARTTATYYTTDEGSYLNNQPVVLVEKESPNYSDYVEIPMPSPKAFDLSLRKFITKINGVNVKVSRKPIVDVTNLVNGTATTAIYNHPKAPLDVEIGDIVTYKIRVYNEGGKDGYVSMITDHLPAQLEFLPDDPDNLANGWYYDENDITLRTIKTEHLSKNTSADNLIKAFDPTRVSLEEPLYYKEVEVKCKVVDDPTFTKRIVNIAEITGFTDKNGNAIVDRDSQSSNVVLPNDEELPNYKQVEIDRGDTYIPGQQIGNEFQDDDDFDNVKINYTYFDLSLRKFITSVNGKVPNESREPKVDVTNLVNGTDTTAIYNHPKYPLQVKVGDIVTYTIRVYNEGTKDGYANVITDHLPKELEFLPEDKENKAKGWDYDETDPTHRTIKTEYLSKENSENNLIKAFDPIRATLEEPLYYKEITVKCKVVADEKHTGRIVNIAEITDAMDINGKTNDRDSQVNNVVLPSDEELPNYKQEEIDRGDKYIPGQKINGKFQDDDDFDNVEIVYFDLALRKFITKVDSLDINNRYPSLSMGEDGNIKYTHIKEPVPVANSNIVTYTIRIYNEGTIAGYAKEVTDDLPEGLVFLPENETNEEYRWIMIDKDGNKTEDVEKAEKITTDYLSKAQEKTAGENLLKAFDKKAGLTETNPDYRDVKVAFKVTEPNTSNRILINTAEISEDSDENDKPIDDIDSTPGNGEDGEDDIDIDKVKVKYFDLALKKWVTQAIVTQNGKTTITETGHTGEENPEPVVKVDLKKSDLKKVTVKFKYKIKVTNEGELEGYVKEIKDYIPDGLKFVADDNPLWKQISEKEVVTEQTKDILLKPGESTTVEIILTWENSDKNLGLKVNWAEISKDYNDYGDTPDIDSTPDNNKPGEDDIDNAPVILGVKTGEAEIYVTLTTIILITMAGGIVLIKKFVL